MLDAAAMFEEDTDKPNFAKYPFGHEEIVDTGNLPRFIRINIESPRFCFSQARQ